MAFKPKKEEKVAKPAKFVTNLPLEAEKIQVATGQHPEVTGSSLYAEGEFSRKYTFNGISAVEARAILNPPATKDETKKIEPDK